MAHFFGALHKSLVLNDLPVSSGHEAKTKRRGREARCKYLKGGDGGGASHGIATKRAAVRAGRDALAGSKGSGKVARRS